MKKYVSVLGAFSLAVAMSGLPAIAFAEDNGGVRGDATAQVQTQGADAQVGVTAREGGSVDQQKQQEQENQLEATGSNVACSEEQVGQGQNEQEINLDLEDDSNPATSFGDLQQKIEIRKQQLEQEVASTTSADKNIVEDANPVRLAVHSLLASKNLLGGIGPQVSEIAKEVNDSVATTTNVEVKIQSRGFLTRFFFGGDSASADVISQEVARNQQRIDDLTKLLAGANVSADIQATLNAQITALQDAQARLQALAQKERSSWGIFSWRF